MYRTTFGKININISKLEILQPMSRLLFCILNQVRFKLSSESAFTIGEIRAFFLREYVQELNHAAPPPHHRGKSTPHQWSVWPNYINSGRDIKRDCYIPVVCYIQSAEFRNALLT